MTSFHALEVGEVRRETADAVSIRLEVPPRLSRDFAFMPGQHVSVRAEIGGKEERRTYSICSGLDDGELRIAVRTLPDGIFSTFAATRLAPGMRLDVMPPAGRFTLAPDPGARRRILLAAAGAGITPILSILKSVLAREPLSEVALVYGNRRVSSIMFAETIEDLKNRHMERLTIAHVLSREAMDDEPACGRIDAARLDRLGRGVIGPGQPDQVFLCGPEAMTTALRPALEARGIAPERIHVELFTTAEARAVRPTAAIAGTAVGEGEAPVAEIEAILDGRRRAFPFMAGDAGVIDAAARSGIALPFSCKGGMCCTCRARVLEGSAVMRLNYSLEPWEQEAGFVLTCQARPTSPRLVLDYDQT